MRNRLTNHGWRWIRISFLIGFPPIWPPQSPQEPIHRLSGTLITSEFVALHRCSLAVDLETRTSFKCSFSLAMATAFIASCDRSSSSHNKVSLSFLDPVSVVPCHSFGSFGIGRTSFCSCHRSLAFSLVGRSVINHIPRASTFQWSSRRWEMI